VTVGNCRAYKEMPRMAEDGRGWRGTAGRELLANIGEGNERQETVGASLFEWRIITAGF